MSRSSSALALIGDTFQAIIGIWKCWFLRRGENLSTRGKTSRSREENQQQTQPTYDAGSGNRTRDTLVGGKRSHHCAILLPLKYVSHFFFPRNFAKISKRTPRSRVQIKSGSGFPLCLYFA